MKQRELINDLMSKRFKAEKHADLFLNEFDDLKYINVIEPIITRYNCLHRDGNGIYYENEFAMNVAWQIVGNRVKEISANRFDQIMQGVK